MVPAIALHVAQIQKAQAKAPGVAVVGQLLQPICNLGGFIAQLALVTITTLTNWQRPAGQCNTDTTASDRQVIGTIAEKILLMNTTNLRRDYLVSFAAPFRLGKSIVDIRDR